MDRTSLTPFFPRRSLLSGGDLFSQLQREVDRVFDSFMSPSPFRQMAAMDRFAPAIDVAETADALQVSAELPGCEAKDVDVNLSGRVLTIRGEKKSEREEKGDNLHLVERSYGAFQRAIELPFDVDPDKVEASFDKGVLKLHLPKPPEAKAEAKKIEIKG